MQQFLTNGCGCDLVDGGCSSMFSEDTLTGFRGDCRELTRAELDMVLLGQLSAFTNTSTLTTHSTTRSGHPSLSRQRLYSHFWSHGRRICRKTFLTLHCISDKRLRNLQKSLKENGLAPRRHGNTRRLPSNAYSFQDRQRAIEFLHSYAEANAILLPGRIPGYKRSDVQLLPSSTTKNIVWQQYSVALAGSTHHQLAYSTFCLLWRRVVPQILVTKPMSDLCWICQKNSTAIMRSANLPEEEKSAVR